MQTLTPQYTLSDGTVDAQNAIDLTAVITTPENIQFEYRIAGPFRRLPALLLDFAVRVVIFMTIGFLLAIVGAFMPFSGGIVMMGFLISWFVMDWFYSLLFESYWNGQTPGKFLTKIRVISVDGRPINVYQATVRNFLRLADIAPMVSLEVFVEGSPPAYIIPTFLTALICMSLTTRFQRLGDIAAGTMVIVNERAWVPANVKLEDPRIASLSEYIPANFRMSSTLAKAIALYAERRSRIPAMRRNELANHLAKPLLKQFNFRDDTSPDLLVCALYYREFVAKDVFTDAPRIVTPPPANVPVDVVAGEFVAGSGGLSQPMAVPTMSMPSQSALDPNVPPPILKRVGTPMDNAPIRNTT